MTRMELLRTKLHIPEPAEQQHLILRTSLIERLHANAGKPLLLIQAPAGYGKTTLLSQWIHHKKMAPHVCWFSIDKMDNRISTFWAYVFHSIAQTHHGLCRSALIRLESEANQPVEEVLISALNEIEASDRRILLVLDDYHLIHSRLIHDSLNFLFDHPLDNLSVILSSREKPRLDDSRLRLSGRMFELTKSDLKFTEAETLQAFTGTGREDLPPEQKKHLLASTEGWAAAIRLFALHPQGIQQARGPACDASGLLIHEYMWQEIFGRLDQALRQFLTAVSFLDRFCPQLCLKVTGDPLAETHLQYLIRHQFFIIPLDSDGVWFRFHHLFQDFLRSEFAKLPPRMQAHCHYQASLFFHEAGLFDEAFSHALETGDDKWAGTILSSRISVLYGHGSDELVSSYLNRLDPATIFSDPILCGYYLGFKIYTGDFDRVRQLEQLIDRMQTEKDRRIAQGFHLAFKAYQTFCVSGDLDTTIALAENAKALLPRNHGAMIRMLEYMQTISYRYSGQVQKAIVLCRPGRQDDLLMSALTATNSADLDIELGRLTAAHENIRNRIAEVETVFKSGPPPSIYGFLHIIMGKILKLQNRIESAQDHFAKGLVILKNTEMWELVIIGTGEYAHFMMVCGKYEKAHDYIDKAIHLTRLNFSWVENLMQAVKHWILIKQGNLEPVAVWAGRYPVEQDYQIPFIQNDEYLVIARYLIAVKDFERAGLIVDSFITKDLEDRRMGRLIECYVLKAKILHLGGNPEAATDYLLKAFDLSRRQGQVMVYLQDADGMEELFTDLLAAGKIPAYLAPHLTFARRENPDLPPKTVSIHDYVETFSQRETDLLKLFQKGLSNKEAADRLCLSVNTVRWYASRIFSKLDVKRRGQAVSKALEYGLI